MAIRPAVQPGRAQMPTGMMAYTQDGGLGGGSPEGDRRRAMSRLPKFGVGAYPSGVEPMFGSGNGLKGNNNPMANISFQNQQIPAGMGQNQQMPNGRALPQTGLIGSEQAMTTGLSGAMSALGGNYGGGSYGGGGGGYGGGGGRREASQMAVDANPTQGYQQGGEQAQQMNAALTGALGADAQAQAYAQFQESPGQAYLREQAERGLTRNAAAIGGLGGGAVRSALQEQAIGMAAQDFENQFNRRGTVADRGMNAANTEAEILMGQDRNQTSLDQSNISANTSRYNTNVNSALQRNLAAAGYQFDSGNNIAAGRTNAGNNIANNIAQSSSNLANFINNQGTNIGNIYGGAGAQQGSSFTDYANNAANIRGNAAGNFMGVSGVPANNQNTFGNYGQLLQGIGGGLQAYNQYQQQPQNAAPVFTGANPNYGTAGASAVYPSYTNNYA